MSDPDAREERVRSVEERIAAIVAYEGSYGELEKLALETLARTARDALFCFELAMSMQQLRRRIGEERRQRGKRA